MEESYLLHILLKYYSDAIKIGTGSFELAGKIFSFEHIGKSTILRVSEFKTKEDAEKFARKLKGMNLESGIGFPSIKLSATNTAFPQLHKPLLKCRIDRSIMFTQF